MAARTAALLLQLREAPLEQRARMEQAAATEARTATISHAVVRAARKAAVVDAAATADEDEEDIEVRVVDRSGVGAICDTMS